MIVEQRTVESTGPGAGAASADSLDDIGRLAALRDCGALSDTEFEARKQALLRDT